MITPEYLEYMLDTLKVHKELQESIIRDIARRMIKNPELLANTAAWQAEKAQQAGFLYSDLIKELSRRTRQTESEIKRKFDDAEVEIFNYDDAAVEAAGFAADTFSTLSPHMQRIWSAALSKTSTEAVNLTKTTAVTAQSLYIQACDLAHMQVSSGAFDYNTAIRNAVRFAAEQGVTVVYPSGHIDKLDTAVRRSVLTGINQTAGQLQNMRAKEMSCDIMEISAHTGARPSHAEWQGKLVSLSGKKGYLTLKDIEYGEVTGFMGANCRHNWFMFFPGISKRAYTDEELEQMNNQSVKYNGEDVPVWKARDYQRRLERAVKSTKRELLAYDEAQKNAADPELKAGLGSDFESASVRLKKQEARLKDFCKQTGLRYDNSRVQVFSAKTENGIRNWDKSVAQKAVAANKRALTQKAEDDIIKEIKSCGLRGKIHLTPTAIDTSILSFDNVHINKERNHDVTFDEAVSYIKNAKISVTVWNGRFERYYSEDGVSYVDIERNLIRTAFHKRQFDDNIRRLMEVLRKHGR